MSRSAWKPSSEERRTQVSQINDIRKKKNIFVILRFLSLSSCFCFLTTYFIFSLPSAMLCIQTTHSRVFLLFFIPFFNGSPLSPRPAPVRPGKNPRFEVFSTRTGVFYTRIFTLFSLPRGFHDKKVERAWRTSFTIFTTRKKFR